MQTQCPHCETKFRVTETQVHAADGFVRCGICKEVFNAIEVASRDKHQQSLLAAEEGLTAETAEDAESPDEAIIIQPAVERYAVETAAETVHQTEELGNKTAGSASQEKDTYDFFNDDAEEAQQHVVPEKYRDSYSGKPKSLVSTILWSIATLLLTVTLLLEYTWFNRNQPGRFPFLQTAVEKLCLRIECRDISIRDPSKIELITRNVYSHPVEKGALMVNVTMKNSAGFAQPYPVMQIDFSDIRGGIVSARRFYPEEYMPVQNNAEALHLLQPDTETTVTLEIQDPGKQAMTYEFNFL